MREHPLEHRIPPPALGALIGLLMWLVARLGPTLDLAPAVRLGAALAAVLLGAAFAGAGAWSFRRARTTVNPLQPDSASALVTSGVYRYTRNPMYVGFACLLLGWALYLAAPWALLGPLAFVLFMNRFQIAPEERALARLFGAGFEAYRARVRRWL